MKLPVTLLAVFFISVLPAFAQNTTVVTDDRWCEERGRNNRNVKTYCEVHEITLSDRNVVKVDAGMNGGVDVEGWGKDEILVRARIVGAAKREQKARELVSGVDIRTRNTIKADFPGSRNGLWRENEWVVVSYKIYVPEQMDVDLETHNGGVSIVDVEGDIEFEVLNGGVTLVDLAGDVSGHTTNGGLHIDLAGEAWEGRGLDVSTTNGGVVMTMPEDYSARLETGTVNGDLHFDFPVMVKGNMDQKLTVTLGDGGPRIRATTTNGSVHLKQR